jgi:hypothetical protein
LLCLKLFEMSGCGAIGSALALGARGCQFESGHPDHFLRVIMMLFQINRLFFILLFCMPLYSFCETNHSSFNQESIFLDSWENKYLSSLTPQELQLLANMFHLLHTTVVIELKTQQLSCALTKLNQDIRIAIGQQHNPSEEISSLKVLADRLAFVSGSRIIYNKTLEKCLAYYEENRSSIMHQALEECRLFAQKAMRFYSQDQLPETKNLLKKNSEDLDKSIQILGDVFYLYNEMNDGKLPGELSDDDYDEEDKELLIHSLVLQINAQLVAFTENNLLTFYETAHYTGNILNSGTQLYQNLYARIHNRLITASIDKKYTTTMFSMYGILPEEYRSTLPNADKAFEHALQTTKLYTQTEFSSVK